MPPIKLHKWYLAIAIVTTIIVGCSNKNISQKTIEKEAIEIPEDYTPPQVITVPTDKEKANSEGEIYYDNEYGYRYWKKSDGKFYLFKKIN
ncbi:MAG: hypothetical protein KA319_05310 [Ferruginibacter sp.]|nr:hypothetical protein [Ferruginibacter sp.]